MVGHLIAWDEVHYNSELLPLLGIVLKLIRTCECICDGLEGSRFLRLEDENEVKLVSFCIEVEVLGGDLTCWDFAVWIY